MPHISINKVFVAGWVTNRGDAPLEFIDVHRTLSGAKLYAEGAALDNDYSLMPWITEGGIWVLRESGGNEVVHIRQMDIAE